MGNTQQAAAEPSKTTTSTSTSTSSVCKKKRSPNWLPQEEEQLARSWLKTSLLPEFIANQTSEAFFSLVQLDFNQNSKLHYRDQDQIRIRSVHPISHIHNISF